MSILIRGVEMPKDGEHPIWIALHSDGTVEYNANKGNGWQMTTALSVPEHGRLIEKNAVFELIRSFPNVDRQLPVEFMKALYELPTILEAEEGE